MRGSWFFPPLPASRVAVLRAAIYLVVIYEVLVGVGDVIPHARAPAELYQPLAIGRLLNLPAPDVFWAQALRAGLLIGCVLAATGRLPRVLGWAIALGYAEWVLLGMSYGKVDHDKLALLVALFVLPTAGRCRLDDHRRDERVGWALRCIQLGVVATYLLSVWGKVRHGGWDWPIGATFLWAAERRGTFLGEHLVGFPDLLVAAQWGLLLLELAAPVVFLLRGRALGLAVGAYLGFHLVTYATISIHFLPLVVCWLAFAPLERVAARIRPAGSAGAPAQLRGVRTGPDTAGGSTTGQAGAVGRDEPVEPVG